jgi:hypothetical protein
MVRRIQLEERQPSTGVSVTALAAANFSEGRPRLLDLIRLALAILLTAGLHAQELRAELSPTGEPGRGMAQVDRQLPGAEIPILGQAAADCGLGDQHRQAHVGCTRARVGPPVQLVLAC